MSSVTNHPTLEKNELIVLACYRAFVPPFARTASGLSRDDFERAEQSLADRGFINSDPWATTKLTAEGEAHCAWRIADRFTESAGVA